MKSCRWVPLLLATVVSVVAQDGVDHCIGLVWRKGGTLDLKTLIDPKEIAPQFLENIHFHATVDGNTDRTDGNILADGILPYGTRPMFPEPTIRLVTMCFGSSHQMLDQMWVVINSPQVASDFAIWCTNNTSTAWASSLPRPYSKIALSTNVVTGLVRPIDPEPGPPDLWSASEAHATYLHHDAVYEMRSITDTSSLHGHQATYDSQGNLIQTGIAAGTADYRRPYMFVLWSSETIPNWTHHLEQDVKPFIRALQLDGNPVVPIDCYQNLNRQCLHVGEHTQAYLARRPILPSGFIDVDAEASD